MKLLTCRINLEKDCRDERYNERNLEKKMLKLLL